MTGSVARRHVGRALVVIGLMLAAAVPVGLIWGALAPRVPLVVTERGLALVSPESSEAFAADGLLAVLTGVAGAGSGALAFARGRLPPGVAVLALAAGGLLAGPVAAVVGIAVGPPPLPTDPSGLPVGSSLAAPLRVGAPGVLLAWAITAVGSVLALDLGSVPVSPGERSEPSPPP